MNKTQRAIVITNTYLKNNVSEINKNIYINRYMFDDYEHLSEYSKHLIDKLMFKIPILKTDSKDIQYIMFIDMQCDEIGLDEFPKDNVVETLRNIRKIYGIESIQYRNAMFAASYFKFIKPNKYDEELQDYRRNRQALRDFHAMFDSESGDFVEHDYNNDDYIFALD